MEAEIQIFLVKCLFRMGALCSSDVALSYMHAQDPCAKFLQKKLLNVFGPFELVEYSICHLQEQNRCNFHRNIGLVTPHLCLGGLNYGKISRAHRNTCRVVAEILGLVLMEILEKKSVVVCFVFQLASWYYYLGLREEPRSKCFHLSPLN